jgi:hypothetical protein
MDAMEAIAVDLYGRRPRRCGSVTTREEYT